jgi:hypothetical protein
MTTDELKRQLKSRGRDCRGGHDTLAAKLIAALAA